MVTVSSPSAATTLSSARLCGARCRARAHDRGQRGNECHALTRREPNLARALRVGDDGDPGVERVEVEVDQVVGEASWPANDPQLFNVFGNLLCADAEVLGELTEGRGAVVLEIGNDAQQAGHARA